MEMSILSARQKRILDLLAENDFIVQHFYLGGGTALAEFYLHHRYSEDLDFFNEDEFEIQEMIVFLKKMKGKIGYDSMDIQQSFNRNLIFLSFPDKEIVKLEFTYYPFKRIENGKNYGKLAIDSLKDTAVNKLFTIYQNPRSRDYIDLYCILKNHKIELKNLYDLAKIKFDWHIDFLQLGARFLQAREMKDYPRMLINLNDAEWISFYEKLAKEIGNGSLL